MILHASTVAWLGRGVLIEGPSGSGKSTLALQMMAFGAALVADDRTVIAREGDALLASAPPAISGLIEARGVGLLRAEAVPARLVLAVDLGQAEPDRLPQKRHRIVDGVQLPIVLGRDHPHLAAALLQYLKAGRQS